MFNKGFSLIEILISITIFSIVITGFIGLFISTFRYHNESLNLIEFLNSASYATEYMSRALRMSGKDFVGDCASAVNENFDISVGGTKISFVNYNGDCQIFFLEDNRIKVRKAGSTDPLLPASFIVEDLQFQVTGDGQGDNLQPKITFMFKAKLNKPDFDSIILQTTISQRALDVEY